MKKKLLLIIIIAIVFTFSVRIILAETPDTNTTTPGIFRDNSSGMTFSIQLAKNQPDTGQLDLYIPQEGYYRGEIELKGKIKCQEKESCEEDDDDRRDTSKVIHLQGNITTQFYPLDNSFPDTAQIRMEGKINTKHNTAIIHIWIGGTHYRLKTKKGDLKAAEQTARQALQYTNSQDWTGFYDLLAPSIQETTTPEEFTQTMSDNTGLPTILSSDFDGQGEIIVADGYSYFSQPVKLTIRQTDGSMSTAHETDFFILENGSWRFLSNTTPTSP
jgi:hypothetical protein